MDKVMCSKTVPLTNGNSRPCRFGASGALRNGDPACTKHLQQETRALRLGGVRINRADAWWATCEECQEMELFYGGENPKRDAEDWAATHVKQGH